ncbi:hypothetical protein C8Q79DRAFT_904384 [Trametes meyenii]|nr:hypothetical protein C8Q79DRAFT_904384 [Trametes meyenii]
MGRRATHLTAAAKMAAKRLQAKKYRATEGGSHARAKENRGQYRKRTALKNTLLPGLPVCSELLHRGKKMLRASFAVQSAGPLLGLWNPPYQFEVPGNYDLLERPSEAAGGDWDSNSALLGGIQYNKIVSVGWDHYDEWCGTGLDEEETAILVSQEVAVRIQAWEQLRAMPVIDQDAEAMELALDWGAKIACMLAKEWEHHIQGGATEYAASGRSGNLPWQLMMKDVMRLFGEEVDYGS